jgi:hypothetical protein
VLAHNCVVQRIHADMSRLLGEPWGDYHLALTMLSDMVADTNRQADARARVEARRAT